ITDFPSSSLPNESVFNRGPQIDTLDSSFTAEICELKATNGRIEVELERTRSRLDDCLRESYTLRAKANYLRHDIQLLASQNEILRDKLVETRRGIARAIQTLEGIDITLNDTNDSSLAIGIHAVSSEI
ncbi:hypothetical protein N7467_003020, partial [Penicillium canescens]